MCLELGFTDLAEDAPPRRRAPPSPSAREALRERLRVGRALPLERPTRRSYRPQPEQEYLPTPKRVPRRKRARPERARRESIRAREAGLDAVPGALPLFGRSVFRLLNAFETATLAREDFTHAAHLVVALAYAHGQRAEAYGLLREGIQRYNAATGLVETPTRGYHETITQAWFHLVLHFLDLFDEGQSLQSLAEDLIQLFERDDLFRHYSRGLLLTHAARSGWVEPDLEPLPPLEPLTPADRRWATQHRASPATLQDLSRGRVASGPSLSRARDTRAKSKGAASGSALA